jgi:hypothetical protein
MYEIAFDEHPSRVLGRRPRMLARCVTRLEFGTRVPWRRRHSFPGTEHSKDDARPACVESYRWGGNPVQEISTGDPELVGYARMFLTAGPRRPSTSEVRALIRQMLREYVSRDLALGVAVPFSPPGWCRGYTALVPDLIHGQVCLLATGRSSSFDLGLDRQTGGVIRPTMVMVREQGRTTTPDRVDPVSFRWDANPNGQEMVVWAFQRGRTFEGGAHRPLGSTGPWSTTLTGVYEAGETLPHMELSPVIADSLVDDTRPPLMRVGQEVVTLLEPAVVYLHRSEEQFTDLEAAFADLIRFLPDGRLENPGRPKSRLRPR